MCEFRERTVYLNEDGESGTKERELKAWRSMHGDKERERGSMGTAVGRCCPWAGQLEESCPQPAVSTWAVERG
ncbi:hypothetical protein WR25_06036 [Diploscapter pachys]|uniref:Uncharacterized protein n=1 Tax=Diploscapter pachys TaxID=2018661 RepID=A0A2A2LR81_9BILA|nr:hypothetical protein WR25_06036 [Diploscapter pachys]